MIKEEELGIGETDCLKCEHKNSNFSTALKNEIAKNYS
jgi:hypothetical protein